MISEKAFSLGFSSFWNELLPRLESYVRSRNLELARFATPMQTSLPAADRGLVNELAFRMYAASMELSIPVATLSRDRVQFTVQAALGHIRGMRQFSRQPIGSPGEVHIREAGELAGRIALFFENAVVGPVLVTPRFAGCGWLDECEGDALAAPVLYEMKAGERQFRGADIRQVLCYCGLNFASKSYEITEVCLVNPRTGLYLHETLEDLCSEAAGASSVDILSDIVEFCSETFGRYGTG